MTTDILTVLGALIVLLFVVFGAKWFISPRRVRSAVLNIARKYKLRPIQVMELGKLAKRYDGPVRDLAEQRHIYNQVVGRYVKELRTRRVSAPIYRSVIKVLTALRKSLHPPSPMQRYLTSTRDLVPGFDCTIVSDTGVNIDGKIWKLDEDELFVSISGDSVVPIGRAQAATMTIVVPGQGPYSFKTRVRKRLMAPRMGLLMEHADQSQNPNRREHQRLKTNFRVDVSIEGVEEPVQALVRDISAAGIRLLARYELGVEQEIQVILPALISGTDKPLWARVLRVTQRDRVGTYVYGCQWIGLSRSTVESLVRYVQMEQLKKAG